MHLIIGNKLYSSWSLRPWILMKAKGIAFTETVVPLHQPDTKKNILEHSPTGKVPLLIDDGIRVWESLAIVEYLDEAHPNAGIWPSRRRPVPMPARHRARCTRASRHSARRAR